MYHTGEGQIFMEDEEENEEEGGEDKDGNSSQGTSKGTPAGVRQKKPVKGKSRVTPTSRKRKLINE